MQTQATFGGLGLGTSNVTAIRSITLYQCESTWSWFLESRGAPTGAPELTSSYLRIILEYRSTRALKPTRLTDTAKLLLLSQISYAPQQNRAIP